MSFFTNLTLGKRITLLTVMGLVVGIGVFGFLGIKAVNQATEVTLEDRVTTARLVASYLDEALGRAQNELIDTTYVIVTEQSSNFEGHIKELEDAFHRLSIRIHSLYLLNGEGKIIWSKPVGAEGGNIAFYPGIGQVIQGGAVNTSGLVLAPLGGVPVVLVTVSVGSQPSTSSTTLVVAIDLSQSSIGGFIQPIRLGQTGYVEIVDQNGVVVSRTEPGPKLAPFEKSDHSGRFAALIADGKPTRGLCHTCHEPVQRVARRDVLAFMPLSRARWGVVIRQSEKEALAPVYELRQNLLLFGSAFLIITLFTVVVTTRDVVGRIRMLISAARRMADGDLVSPVVMPEKDEVGVLAQTFEEMRAKLKTSYEALEQKTEELSSLLSVSETLSRLPDLSNLDSALVTALDRTLEIMKAGIGGLMLLQEEKQVLYYHVYRGLSEDYIQGMWCRLGEGIAGRVAQSGAPITVADISQDPRATHAELINKENLRAFASVPLRSKEKILGVLNIASHEVRDFSPESVRLLEGIAGQIATAIENARLHQEVQHKEQVRGQLLQAIYSIQEEERRRIARELHDETSQILASLNASLEATVGMLPENSETIKGMVRKAQALSINILDGIHKLIYDLRPTLLDDLGLVSATRWLAENKLEPTGVKVEFRTVGRVKRLPPQLETTLFRVTQEAITNIVKHARAKNGSIILYFRKNNIRVLIKDDGRGFNVSEAISAKGRPRGLGLLGMKERIELVRGTLDIRSRPRNGTEVDIEIPLIGEINGQNKNSGSR